MSTPFGSGDEFLINDITVNAQTAPAVTALSDGRFVVTWTDVSLTTGDNSGNAVRAQIFFANGTPVGPEFLVNTTTPGNQQNPTITALENGGFVIAWEDTSATGGDTTGTAIRAQVYGTDGAPVGAEVLVNTTTLSDQTQPTITALADGNFVVAWTDASTSATTGLDLKAQVFHANGTPSGIEFLVNSATALDETTPVLTALDNGSFVAVWTDISFSGGDTTNTAVRAQIFDFDGFAYGPEFLVNTTTIFSQKNPTVTTLAGGGFVVAWTDQSTTGGDTSSDAIRAQAFAADGSRVGAEFLVNTITPGAQNDPTITGLSDGRFVVAWADASLSLDDPSGSAIRAQVFNADGTRHGTEFLVATETLNAQQSPTITTLADGRFMIGWTDFSGSGGDTSSSGIKGRIFDERDAAVHLNGTVADDFFVGTYLGDVMSGGFGSDVLIGGQGDDDLYGSFGIDFMSGNKGNDQAFGGDGDDALYGGQGSDMLDGGAGNDFLEGGLGQDALIGGTGDDIYTVDLPGDLVIEASGLAGGRDTVQSGTISLNLALYANVENATLTDLANLALTGSGGANVLIGNAGANVILGLGGNDNLDGGAGADSLNGGDGSDKLTGGMGVDTMTGGTGADVFIFASAAEAGTLKRHDQITDFLTSLDRIDLHAIQAGQTFTTAAFEGIAGQVRYDLETGFLTGDLNGDRVADYWIALTSKGVLTAADLIL